MKNNHIVTNHSVFGLTAKNNHGTLIINSGVVFANANRDALCFQDIYSQVVTIVLNNLVSALPHLSLSVKHETTTKNDYFALIMNCRVALSALNHFLRVELHFFPVDCIAHNLSTCYFFDRLIIHSSNHIHSLTNLSYSSTFTRRRNP
jgi:hypothetical protein